MKKKNQIGKIMEKIKAEGIEPESKLSINWKSHLFWLVWGGMLFLGAIFFSLIILNFLDLGPEISHLFDFPLGRLMHLLMMTTPFVWLSLVLIALGSGLLALRKTRRGYRYSLLLVTSLSVLAISLLGSILHFSRFNQRIGGHFSQSAGEPRKDWAFPMGNRWKLPEDGFLGGKILEIEVDSFLIESFARERWEVFFDEKTEKIFSWPLAVGMSVGLMGEKTGEKQFKADFIRELPAGGPVGRGGRGMGRMERKPDLENQE